jgi:hypothetical protein
MLNYQVELVQCTVFEFTRHLFCCHIWLSEEIVFCDVFILVLMFSVYSGLMTGI